MEVTLSLEIEPPGTPLGAAYVKEKSEILSRARELCGWTRGTFPGSQPVSLSNVNISELEKHAYVACEKTDGVRYLLLALSNRVFLIDRKESIQVIDMCLPKKQSCLSMFEDAEPDEVCKAWLPASKRLARHRGLLLDGELVLDKTISCSEEGGNPTSQKQVRFLIYDAICLNKDTDLKRMNLIQRLQLCIEHVMKPRNLYIQLYKEEIELERQSNNFLELYVKDFFEIWDVPAVLNFQKRLPHESDGIIFTPVNIPYMPGTSAYVLKWKPPHLNTVDFAGDIMYGYLKDNPSTRVPCAAKLFVGVRGMRTFVGNWLATVGPIWRAICTDPNLVDFCDSQIWECSYDEEIVTVTFPSISIDEARKMLAEPHTVPFDSSPPSILKRERDTTQDTVAPPSSKFHKVEQHVESTLDDDVVPERSSSEDEVLSDGDDKLSSHYNSSSSEDEDEDDWDRPATTTKTSRSKSSKHNAASLANEASVAASPPSGGTAPSASHVDSTCEDSTTHSVISNADRGEEAAQRRVAELRARLVCPVLEDRMKTCYYDLSKPVFDSGGWILERIRTDKKLPNDARVTDRVRESIMDGISCEMLLKYILHIQNKPTVTEMCEIDSNISVHGTRWARQKPSSGSS